MEKNSADYGQVNGDENPSSSSNDNQLTRPKNLLRDQSIKNIIITAIIGNGITGDAYSVGANEQHDGRRADMIYIPLKEFARDLAPVIVEIQNKVNHAFVARNNSNQLKGSIGLYTMKREELRECSSDIAAISALSRHSLGILCSLYYNK